MPRLDRELQDRLTPVKGTPPSLINVPSGCAFHPRCPYAELTGGRSTTELPTLTEVAPRHHAACHLPIAERHRIFAEEIAPRL
jgi:peptide/nickel transport system ATP-binding protein